MNTFESSGVNDLTFCLWVLLARSKPRTVLPRPMVMRPPRLARHPAREAFFGTHFFSQKAFGRPACFKVSFAVCRDLVP